MPDDVFSLFDDYAARFARGERPEPRAYLARAGDGADQLAQLIDGYLARATPPPSEDTVAVVTAALHGRSPLREARRRGGLSRADVVDALVAALGLDHASRARVARYYEELETAVRDPRRVDRRVFEALAVTLRARASDLAYRGARARIDGLGFSLETAAPAPPPQAALAAPPAPVEPPDEVDRLFGAA